jgi:CubicO group peptidase (beta-lactamase class C family)
MNRCSVRCVLLLALALLLIAAVWSGPGIWKWYQQSRVAADSRSYQPRELVAGANQPPAPRMAPDLEQLNRAGLDEAAAYAGAHGSRALIVSRHGYIVYERYWQGTSFDTLTDAQSFTPLLAGLAAGVAVSHRMIGWPDEPVAAFIGEWSQDARGAITVRNLMQYESGLAPALSPASSADLKTALLGERLVGPAGSARVEKPADPLLLALVIERATRQRYASYLSQALWRRLGAADAWLWLDGAGETAHAECCLIARQGDWIRLGELLLRDGNYRGSELIRPGWITLMRAPSKADPDHGAYLTLASARKPNQEPYATPDVFVVQGQGGNRLWLVPSLQLAILCTGAPAGRDAAWDDARVPNLIIRTARDYVPPPAKPAGVPSLLPGHQP